MNEQEQKEFTSLKYTLFERGFLLAAEQVRWNYLFDKNARSFIEKMRPLDLLFNQIENN